MSYRKQNVNSNFSRGKSHNHPEKNRPGEIKNHPVDYLGFRGFFTEELSMSCRKQHVSSKFTWGKSDNHPEENHPGET